MGDNMLSTPQKVLRETLRAKMSIPSFDLNKEPQGKDIYEDTEPDDDDNDTTEPDEEEEDEVEKRGRQMNILTEEEKREIRRIRGRESYARRKEASATSGRGSRTRDHNGDAVLNGLESEAQVGSRPTKKKRKSDIDHAYRPRPSESESDGDGTEAPKGAKRRKSDRGLASTGNGESATNMHFPTPPKKQRMHNYDSADTGSMVVSKFIEGSMRDRASAVPPKDIIGLLPNSSPAGPDGETARELAQRQSTDSAGNATVGSANTSLLGSIGSAAGALNPFRFAHRIKDIWEKQKAEYMAHERKKRMLADRRKKSEQEYQRLKVLGAAQGLTGNAAAVAGANQIKFRYNDFDMTGVDGHQEDIGMASSTDSGDEASAADEAGGASGKKRRSGLTGPVGSDVAVAAEKYTDDNERSESEALEYHSTRSPISDYSRASSAIGRTSDRRSGSHDGRNARGSLTSSRMLSPPLTEGAASKLNEVKTLVKKRSKVFVNSIIGKDDKKDDSGAKAERAPTKRELKKQERLRSRVSNLEEQLERAKRELENATRGASVPPVPKISGKVASSSSEKPAVDVEVPRNPQSTNDLAARSDTEGEETEVDEVNEGFSSVIPLSPVINTSFGGSFNATAMAGMSILESLNEAGPSSALAITRNTRRSAPYPRTGSGLRALPKRASTPVLGDTARANLAATRGLSASAKGACDSPPPPPRADTRAGGVPSVPRLSRRASGL